MDYSYSPCSISFNSACFDFGPNHKSVLNPIVQKARVKQGNGALGKRSQCIRFDVVILYQMA